MLKAIIAVSVAVILALIADQPLRNREPAGRDYVGLAACVAILLSLLWLPGCAVDPVRYHADFDGSSLTDAHFTAAARAADVWCEATDGACCPTITRGDNDGQPLAAVSQVRNYDGSPADALGITLYGYAGGMSIEILDTLDDALFARVVLHELGHACRLQAGADPHGLGHLPAGNVMAPYDHEQPDAPTREDVDYATGEAR